MTATYIIAHDLAAGETKYTTYNTVLAHPNSSCQQGRRECRCGDPSEAPTIHKHAWYRGGSSEKSGCGCWWCDHGGRGQQIDFVESGEYESADERGECSSDNRGDSSDECDEYVSRKTGGNSWLRKTGGNYWHNGTAASDAGKGEAIANRTRLSTRRGQGGDQEMDAWISGRQAQEDGLETDTGTATSGVQTRARREAANVRAEKARAEGDGDRCHERHRTLVRDEVAQGPGAFSSFNPRSLREAVSKRRRCRGTVDRRVPQDTHQGSNGGQTDEVPGEDQLPGLVLRMAEHSATVAEAGAHCNKRRDRRREDSVSAAGAGGCSGEANGPVISKRRRASEVRVPTAGSEGEHSRDSGRQPPLRDVLKLRPHKHGEGLQLPVPFRSPKAGTEEAEGSQPQENGSKHGAICQGVDSRRRNEGGAAVLLPRARADVDLEEAKEQSKGGRAAEECFRRPTATSDSGLLPVQGAVGEEFEVPSQEIDFNMDQHQRMDAQEMPRQSSVPAPRVQGRGYRRQDQDSRVHSGCSRELDPRGTPLEHPRGSSEAEVMSAAVRRRIGAHQQGMIRYEVQRDALLRLGVLSRQQQREADGYGWHMEMSRMVLKGLNDEECWSIMAHYPGDPAAITAAQYGEVHTMYTDPEVQINARHTRAASAESYGDEDGDGDCDDYRDGHETEEEDI